MTRARARHEVEITLAGAARILLAGALGAFLEVLVGPPIRWGLLALGGMFALGAVMASHRQHPPREG